MFCLQAEIHDRLRAEDTANKAAWEAARAARHRAEMQAAALHNAAVFAKVDGSPWGPVAEYIRAHGSVALFKQVRVASKAEPWCEFGGQLVIGRIETPDQTCCFRFGDHDCDFENAADAFRRCPKASAVRYRESSVDTATELMTSFQELGWTDAKPDTYVYTLPRNMCFGPQERLSSNFPFQHLRVLCVEGNIKLEQFTLAQCPLERLEICQNKETIRIGIVNLSALQSIKLYRCQRVRLLHISGTTLQSLKSLKIEACQQLDCDALWDILKDCTALTSFTWADIFKRWMQVHDEGSFMPHVNFLSKVAAKVNCLQLERFNANKLLHILRDVNPMESVFDQMLLGVLGNGHLHSATIRGCTLFSALPIPRQNKKLTFVDASSCKQLKQLFVYDTFQYAESTLQHLILDNCPLLENLDNLMLLNNLRTLSLQDCTGVTNELFHALPMCIEQLDLSGCTKIGDLDATNWSMLELPSLVWVSFKGSNLVSSDVPFLLDASPQLLYLNLSMLELPGVTVASPKLATLLMINVTVSSAFVIECPALEVLWLGNTYGGWPWKVPTHRGSKVDCAVHGPSLVHCVAACANYTRTLRIYLPEVVSTNSLASNLAFSHEDFWFQPPDDPCRFSGSSRTFEGYNPQKERDCSKVRLAETEIEACLKENVENVRECKENACGCSVNYSVRIPCGRLPGSSGMPPDSKWHTDHSRLGGGHDGGFMEQCESEWY